MMKNKNATYLAWALAALCMGDLGLAYLMTPVGAVDGEKALSIFCATLVVTMTLALFPENIPTMFGAIVVGVTLALVTTGVVIAALSVSYLTFIVLYLGLGAMWMVVLSLIRAIMEWLR